MIKHCTYTRPTNTGYGSPTAYHVHLQILLYMNSSHRTTEWHFSQKKHHPITSSNSTNLLPSHLTRHKLLVRNEPMLQTAKNISKRSCLWIPPLLKKKKKKCREFECWCRSRRKAGHGRVLYVPTREGLKGTYDGVSVPYKTSKPSISIEVW